MDKKSVLNFIKGHAVSILLLALICILLMKMCSMSNGGGTPGTIVTPTDSTHTTTIISNSEEFKALKKKNKELYDSLKKYKDNVQYVVQFKYKKEYVVDTVYVAKEQGDVFAYDDNHELVALKDSVYEYKSDQDTINYNLKIASKVEPTWYSMNLGVSERFTIVNKQYGDQNVTTIHTDGEGEVTDVTTFNKKKKTNIWERFAIGPSVSGGYDVVNKKVGVQIGVGVTYNLLPKKKK